MSLYLLYWSFKKKSWLLHANILIALYRLCVQCFQQYNSYMLNSRVERWRLVEKKGNSEFSEKTFEKSISQWQCRIQILIKGRPGEPWSLKFWRNYNIYFGIVCALCGVKKYMVDICWPKFGKRSHPWSTHVLKI